MTTFFNIAATIITFCICVMPIAKEAGASEKMKEKERIIIDFSRAEARGGWFIINDGVMGGHFTQRNDLQRQWDSCFSGNSFAGK